MNDTIQKILDSIEAARQAGEINNDAARAASVSLGLEGDEAMLANRVLAQGSDPASLEYVITGSVSDHIATAHRQGPGSLGGEERRHWLLLAAMSADESEDSNLRERVIRFSEGIAIRDDAEAERAIRVKEAEILALRSVGIIIGDRGMQLYDADLGFAAAYWAGEQCAAVLGVYDGEPYVAVGADQSRDAPSLEELGVPVDKALSTHFGVIEDRETVARFREHFDEGRLDR